MRYLSPFIIFACFIAACGFDNEPSPMPNPVVTPAPTDPVPACVPEGLVQGDTFEVTACGDGKTAVCQIVENGGGGTGAIVPGWGCTYGGLLCVQGCESGVASPKAAPACPAAPACHVEVTTRFAKPTCRDGSNVCIVHMQSDVTTADYYAGSFDVWGCSGTNPQETGVCAAVCQ